MEAGIGVVDVPANSTQGGDATGTAGDGAAGATQKMQKLFLEDEESDDGMGDFEAEIKKDREAVAAAEQEIKDEAKVKGEAAGGGA